jgi:hypothetical protein
MRLSFIENSDFQKVSFQNQSQFSQGNNVLDASASTIDGFLWRDTCVSSTLLKSPIWNKESLSPPLKT